MFLVFFGGQVHHQLGLHVRINPQQCVNMKIGCKLATYPQSLWTWTLFETCEEGTPNAQT